MLTAQDNPYGFEKNFATKLRSADHEVDSRMHQYDIGFYHLNLDMGNTSAAVSGNTLIYLSLNETYQNELVFDLKQNMNVSQVLINGVSASFTHEDNLIVIPCTFTEPHSSGYDICADIHYSGTPAAGMTCSNFTFLAVYNYKITYSLSEPYEAKYWFPCKQELTDKADSVWVFVTVPNDLKAGSQGLLTNTVDLGNGKKRMEWKSHYPIAYYLISVAVGDYRDYSFNAYMSAYDEEVLVQNYIPNNDLYFTTYQANINRTDTMIDLLSTLFGKYPFYLEKYGHCIVKLNGGMEHQTMTTLGSFDFRLVLHELGHSWFGDFITCATWSDIWINEGFASYIEYLGEEFIQPDGYEDGWLDECQGIAKQATTGSVYVPFSELNNEGRIFDYKLSYRKGACLLHMIRYIVNNDAVFFAFMKEYVETYGNSTATGDDFQQILSTYTGINFATFFENWYYGEGYPQYAIEWSQQEPFLHIRSTQTTTAASTPFFEIPVEYEVVYTNGDRDTFRLNQTQNIQEYSVLVNEPVSSINPDPNNYILKDILSVILTSSKEFAQNAVQIYPNPASEYIEVQSSEKIDKIQILSSDGKQLYDQNILAQPVHIDISSLSPGIYWLGYTITEKTTMWKKIIVSQ